MGRQHQGKKQRLLRRDFKGGNKRPDTWDDSKDRRPGQQADGQGQQQQAAANGKDDHGFNAPIDLNNAAFEEYYKTQGIVPDGEWEAFTATLRRPLPITFRINGSGRCASELREALEHDFFANFEQGPIVLDGEVVDPPRPLPWYPSKLAWHLNFSRGQLRKLPWLSEIHEFMKAANEAGSITRQEAVSMVPPLFMDVRPHHKVLDMCAAPGSKTFQLLEMLHDFDASAAGAGSAPAQDSAGHGTPSGFVVANDADAQRCNLLTHQTKRMCSPCLMVTNHEAQAFPRISAAALSRPAPGSAAAAAAAVDGALQQQPGSAEAAAGSSSKPVRKDDVMLFDRILADVPCSGDGTMRKAPDIWRRWSINNGNSLHNLQLRIALQAARLLQVGGRMVYSTCTFNPIEDEAVVAELLVRCGGSLQLLDVSGQLPNLKRLPGLRSWKVRDKYRWYDTWEEAQKISFKLDPTMFSSPEKQQLPMERCMRFLPHHQDTGGFFVAVLEKVAPTPPLEDPRMDHRFATYLQPAGPKQPRIIKCDGADPLQGAAAAAEVALQAASSALDALASSDAAAAEAAVATAAAAHARASTAKDAAIKSGKLAAQYEAQEAKHAAKKQQQQQDAAAGADAEMADADAAAAVANGDAAAAAMDGVEEEQQQQQQAEAAAAAPVAAAEAGSGGAAAPAAAKDGAAAAAAGAGGGGAGWTPTWARGGGGRGREKANSSKGGGGFHRGIDPIYPVQDPKILQMLVEFFGIDPAFPLSTHLITRSLECAFPKRLYYVSDSLLSLLLADEREALKITSTGLKLFERQDNKARFNQFCSYRIAQEGLPFLLPHLTKQVIRLGVGDFLRLLKEKSLPLPASANPPASTTPAEQAAASGNGSAPEQAQQPAAAAAAPNAAAPAAAAVKKPPQARLETPEVLQQLPSVRFGGAVAVLEEEEARSLGMATSETSGALTVNAPLAIAVWRTPASLGVLVAKGECDQLVDKVSKALAKRDAARKKVPAAATA